MCENELREKGYHWNCRNLERVRNSLQDELIAGSAFSSIGEVAPEYVAEKLFGRD